MLQTVLDTCRFKQDAIDFALTKQIEDLYDLVGHSPEDANNFFDKTYVTDGMATLIRQGLQRLAGRNDQAVFELRQAMGGGKTHSMLALGYLAANPEVTASLDPSITEGFTPTQSKVVVVSGRNIPHDKFLWGSVAEQLGKADEFAPFFANGAKFPNESDWIDLIGDEPVLILFDELPPYLEAAVTMPVGGGTLGDVTSQALSNLFSAATKSSQLCIVLSTLKGQYKASTDLAKIIDQITNEARRQAKPITPVEFGSDEIYAILRKRLLESEPDASVVESVADEYAKILSDAVTSKTLERSAEKIASEVQATYPFHPSLKTVVATFKDNENFRQTRGLMTIAALMIKSAQARKHNDAYLLGPQHMNLADRETRDFVNNIYNLDAAITQDIVDTGATDAHAEKIDDEAGNDAASQAARLILMASLAEASDAVKGLQENEVLAFLLAPNRTEAEFIAGFDALRTSSWYLHKRDNGAWFFSKNENLTKKIENTARNAPVHKIDQDLGRRLDEVFSPKNKSAYSKVQPLPKVEEIDTRGDRVLIVLSPDAKLPPETAIKLFTDTAEKNNFAIVSGEGHSLSSVEEKVRTAYAIEKVLKEEGLNSPNRPELEERQAEAELDVYSTIASTLNKIWYPAKDVSGDPPYADAVVYHELTEFFISWLRKNPPAPFDKWTWDSRRPLAIQGEGEEFRRKMVSTYANLAEKMPDNGIQIVMFTHQSGSVWADLAQIFWGAGLKVSAAWYIATETGSNAPGKRGAGLVQGTVILVLRKRAGDESGYEDEIAHEVRAEVARQIDTLVGLNQSLKGEGRMENLFEDSDLQMAGYAAALRVLTGYTKIDGRDMTAEATRPRQRGEKGFVERIIDFAVQVANEHMVPEGLSARLWQQLTGTERFYLKMLGLESAGLKKLDNYQNFARAFRVPDYSVLMADNRANSARLKRADDLKHRTGFDITDFGSGVIRAVLYGAYQLSKEVDPDVVIEQLHEMVENYFRRRDELIEVAEYLAAQRGRNDDKEGRHAATLAQLIRNERIA